MSGAGIDPAERARVLLLRGDELLAAGTPESLDEALLAYKGGLEVAREPGVEDAELPRELEERIASVRRRLDPGADDEEETETRGGAPEEEATAAPPAGGAGSSARAHAADGDESGGARAHSTTDDAAPPESG
jgi:hypothetical protein